MRRIVLAMAVVTALVSAVLAAPANATYIGSEGRLAFVRANQIYTVAKSGGAVKQLTTVGKNYRPKWSPDGQRIAYIKETAAGAKDVWVMSATGAAKTRVTHLGTVTAAASWSPDGSTLAFAAGGSVGQVCEFNSCYQPLYTIRSRAPFGSPTPRVGYDNEPWNGPDPTDVHPILVDRFLAWSPDGDHIAIFGHIDAHDDDSISMYDLNTGENLEVLATGSDGTGYAEWSDLNFGPDGTLGYSQIDQGCCFDEHIVKLVYPGFVAVLGDKSPAPSPTNSHMAFVNGSSGTPRIYTATITGQQRKVVVTNGYQPDWQPLP